MRNIIVKSQDRPQIIFKHSTRCSISGVALQRLQKSRQPDDVDFYFLDLISYRSLSNKIAELFGIQHESPQVLVIRDGECIYSESHLGIYMEEILDRTKAA